ncbi:MAG: rhodanese-like domain-containing protein, partial [Patescibacteria group bacterium]|nr:rhodanese-like domain-containing protein [Patescibacteria group bacterium]
MNVKEITSDDLKKLMDTGVEFVLVDLLGEKSYESLHVPQAVSVEPGEGFIEKMIELVKGDLDASVIVYAANFRDELSTIKAQQLLGAGFTNVLDFKGGLKDWAAELYPLEGARAP